MTVVFCLFVFFPFHLFFFGFFLIFYFIYLFIYFFFFFFGGGGGGGGLYFILSSEVMENISAIKVVSIYSEMIWYHKIDIIIPCGN